MERFEYRVVKCPSKSTKYTNLDKATDAFAQTLMDGMNELAIEGWQFVRNEAMVESRRTLLWGSSKRRQDYMVYRRALRSNGMSLDDTVSPNRVRQRVSPNIELLRDRITKVMTDPAPLAAVAK